LSNKLILITSKLNIRNEPFATGIQFTKYMSDKEKEIVLKIRKMFYKDGDITFKEFLLNKWINGDWKKQNFYLPKKEDYNIRQYNWLPDIKYDYNLLMSRDIAMQQYELSGKFKYSKIPILIIESKNDLSWNHKKKMEYFRKNFPKAYIFDFNKSAHGVFQCETHKFFYILRTFLK